VVLFAGGGDAGAQHMSVFHAGLTVYDAQGNLQPQIAQKVPTLEDGDWKLLPEGEMEITWKLRSDVTWHDGTPLTAEDFAFGIRVAQTLDLPLERSAGMRLISQAIAADATTLVVRWSKPFAQANRGGILDVPAVPRHLLADLYSQPDRQAFVNSPYWNTEFVGLGPYRLGEWAPGSHTEAIAFDAYFLGRPRIDRVIIHYFTDANVVVTNVLAGQVDVVAVGVLKPEDLQPIMNTWALQGAGTVLLMNRDVQLLYLQLRDQAAPWARDIRVRRALVHLLDRASLAESFAYGLSSADVFVDQQDPAFPLLEQRGYARYPYDVARAEQLMREAGWVRGSDGVYQNGAERMNIEVRVQANSQANINQGLGVVDLWKQGGLAVDFFSIPPNTGVRGEPKVANRGVFSTSDTLVPATLENFISTQIPTEANGWNGRNFGSDVSPEYDQLHAQFVSALEVPQRAGLQVELLRNAAENVPYIPLYYSPSSGTTVFRRGLTGPGSVPNGQPVTTWNIPTWQLD
jgi:peptide/nickel transport system substrate-binding protein